MSRKNRERRAANARNRRAREAAAAAPRPADERVRHVPRGDPLEHLTVDELVMEAIGAASAGDDVIGFYARRIVDDLDTFATVVTPLLEGAVASCWSRGWQPVEITRHVRRGCPPLAARLLRDAIVIDHRRRSPDPLDPVWVAQVEVISTDEPGQARLTDGAVDDRWFHGWVLAQRGDPVPIVVATISLVVRVAMVPMLDPIIRPPGAPADWRPRVAGTPSVSGGGAETDPVLAKVRALLAKAESSSFEAEADAFTAKAQELIARHAIDAAVLVASSGDDAPSAIRVFVDDPYVDAKSLLLQVVAEAVGCRAVMHTSLAMSTVVGFASDLAAVELLFTSLLVQAQTALAATARHAPPGSRPRSRGFRSAFLHSYASRIGQRLAAVNETVVAEAEAERGVSLLPVLASRDAAVSDTVDDLFGALVTHRLRGGHDAAGWASGRIAAELGVLGGGAITDGGR